MEGFSLEVGRLVGEWLGQILEFEVGMAVMFSDGANEGTTEEKFVADGVSLEFAGIGDRLGQMLAALNAGILLAGAIKTKGVVEGYEDDASEGSLLLDGS